jgi:hypothetical protein
MQIDSKAIHRLARIAPAKALLVAIVQTAIVDAANDPDAARWLASDECLAILMTVTPSDVDPTHIQRGLIARLEKSHVRG